MSRIHVRKKHKLGLAAVALAQPAHQLAHEGVVFTIGKSFDL